MYHQSRRKPSNEIFLYEAVTNGDLRRVKQLIDIIDIGDRSSSNFTYTILKKAILKAAKYGRESVIQHLISCMPLLMLIKIEDENNRTPLHISADRGHLRIVTHLLAEGVDIEAKDQEDMTPLHYAARYGKKAVVELLLQNGAKINAKDTNQWTPLHFAATYGHLGVVKYLRGKGAKIDTPNAINLTTPLHLAVENDNISVVAYLFT